MRRAGVVLIFAGLAVLLVALVLAEFATAGGIHESRLSVAFHAGAAACFVGVSLIVIRRIAARMRR